MNKLKRSLFSAFGILLFVLSLSVAALASELDVSKSYFISKGCETAFFAEKSSESDVTRGEAAELLAGFAEDSAALGVITEKNTAKSFTDSGKYASAIDAVYKYGVISPVGDGVFGTNESISHAELVSAWLSILGYSAEAGDYLPEMPFYTAGELGMISAALDGDVTFAQFLDTSMRALGTPFKNREDSLDMSKAYANAVAKLSPSAENVEFKGDFGEDSFLPIGNICAEDSKADHRFNVSISKGNSSTELDVYKLKKLSVSDIASGEIISGARFAAFNFSGVLTVNIALHDDIHSYTVCSTSSKYSHDFSGGILSVSISEPQNIKVIFNENTEQQIYIFAMEMEDTLSPSDIKNVSVGGNGRSENVSYTFDGSLFINSYRLELKNGVYFSTGRGVLVCAEELCDYFGLDYPQFDFGKVYYFGGVPYVEASAVLEALGFDDCVIDYVNRSVKYIYPDFTFKFDELELQSAKDANLALSADAEGNYKLEQIKEGFGGLVVNITEQYGLSDGKIELDFDAFASEPTKLRATLLAKGADTKYLTADFSLSDELRRCSREFTFGDELSSTDYTEIYLILSPADETYPKGMTYTIAGHTLTREEFYEQDQLMIYPEYPKQINRSYDYKVTVTQGDHTEQIPVYNHTMWYILGNRTIGGDSYRRFSAFAFSGEGVRVDIKVSQDVECYSVMPSALGLKSSFRDGVISVYLDKPEYFLIRLNDRDTTILSVFADYPEFHGDIPAKEDENVIWIDGWYEPSEDEHIVTKDGKVIQSTLSITEPNTILYIAPGAVLNARTNIASTAIGTKVIGRGAIADPYGNIYKTDITEGGNEGSGYRPLSISAAETYVDGITVLDARSFNITVATGSNGGAVELRNVKAMSSMMTSDGISLYNGIGHRVEHCFLYVGDNAFVYSSKGAYIKDCIIGTTCAAFFPQGSTYSYVFEDCHVFASYGGLINNRYNGQDDVLKNPPENRTQQSHTNTFINLDATDCVYLSWFFQGRNMGSLPKTFTFRGVSIPECTGTDNIHSTNGNYEIMLENSSSMLYTENYTLNIHNLYVGGKLITDRSMLDVKVTKASAQKTASNTLSFTGDSTYKPVKQHNVKVDHIAQNKIFVGKMQAVFKGDVIRIGTELAMPADEILDILRTSKTPVTVTEGGKSYVKVSALISSGAVLSAEEKNGALYIIPVYNGENLLLPDEGEISRYTETTCYQVELLTKMDTDGDWIYVMQPNPNAPGVSAGIARFVTDEIKMYGAGTYSLTFKVKANIEEENYTDSKISIALSYDGVNTQYTNFKVHTKSVSEEWQEMTVTFDVTEAVVDGEMIAIRFYGAEHFLLDENGDIVKDPLDKKKNLSVVIDQTFFTDIEFKKN